MRKLWSTHFLGIQLCKYSKALKYVRIAVCQQTKILVFENSLVGRGPNCRISKYKKSSHPFLVYPTPRDALGPVWRQNPLLLLQDAFWLIFTPASRLPAAEKRSATMKNGLCLHNGQTQRISAHTRWCRARLVIHHLVLYCLSTDVSANCSAIVSKPDRNDLICFLFSFQIIRIQRNSTF